MDQVRWPEEGPQPSTPSGSLNPRPRAFSSFFLSTRKRGDCGNRIAWGGAHARSGAAPIMGARSQIAVRSCVLLVDPLVGAAAAALLRRRLHAPEAATAAVPPPLLLESFRVMPWSCRRWRRHLFEPPIHKLACG